MMTEDNNTNINHSLINISKNIYNAVHEGGNKGGAKVKQMVEQYEKKLNFKK